MNKSQSALLADIARNIHTLKPGATFPEFVDIATCALFEFKRDESRHVSHDHSDHIKKLDVLLGNHGVEGDAQLDVTYSNTGDSYGLTLLYHKGELKVASWGDIAETNLV